MPTSTFFLVVLAVNLTFSTAGDIFAKMSGVTNSNNWFYLSLIFALVAAGTFELIVRTGGLAVPASVTLLLTVLFSVFFGAVVFREPIDAVQWLGIGMGFVAIILISNAYKTFL